MRLGPTIVKVLGAVARRVEAVASGDGSPSTVRRCVPCLLDIN